MEIVPPTLKLFFRSEKVRAFDALGGGACLAAAVLVMSFSQGALAQSCEATGRSTDCQFLLSQPQRVVLQTKAYLARKSRLKAKLNVQIDGRDCQPDLVVARNAVSVSCPLYLSAGVHLAEASLKGGAGAAPANIQVRVMPLPGLDSLPRESNELPVEEPRAAKAPRRVAGKRAQ